MKQVRVTALTVIASLLVHALVIELLNASAVAPPSSGSQWVSFSLVENVAVNEPTAREPASPAAVAAPSSPQPPVAVAPRTPSERKLANKVEPPAAPANALRATESSVAESAALAVPIDSTPAVGPNLAPAPPPGQLEQQPFASSADTKLALSPRAVALQTLPPLMAAGPQRPAPDPGSEASATLSADLYAVANAHPPRGRPAPELTRDADGTCHYSGDAIAATIRPDGGVEFHDKAPEQSLKWGATEPPPRPTTLEDQRAPNQLQLAMRASARAWQAERDWFLRETKPLRTQLADAARDRELARDEVGFRRQLDQIWCDTKLSFDERHHRIFALWDETSPDEIGARARSVVVEYVRYHLAVNTTHAFTRDELDTFNADRSQRERFDPYASASARDAGTANP